MNKITAINEVVKLYFAHFEGQNQVAAKDLMPYFIEAGIFVKDQKNGLPIRDILRKLDKENALNEIPYVYADRKTQNTNWYFRRIGSRNNLNLKPIIEQNSVPSKSTNISKKKNSDEAYVLELCDESLNLVGSRQHRFDFLLGDSGTKLPVDIYYPTLRLVIEYRETQHTNEVKFFDKPNKVTVSGVSRGEQRKIYDQRRRDVLPEYGIQLIEIDYSDFEYDHKNKIIRNREKDLEVVKGIMKKIKR